MNQITNPVPAKLVSGANLFAFLTAGTSELYATTERIVAVVLSYVNSQLPKRPEASLDAETWQDGFNHIPLLRQLKRSVVCVGSVTEADAIAQINVALLGGAVPERDGARRITEVAQIQARLAKAAAENVGHYTIQIIRATICKVGDAPTFGSVAQIASISMVFAGALSQGSLKPPVNPSVSLSIETGLMQVDLTPLRDQTKDFRFITEADTTPLTTDDGFLAIDILDSSTSRLG